MTTATRKSETTRKSEHEKAEQLQAALERVSETTIEVVSRDRHIRRKDFAVLIRDLFRKLGLKNISVTTPNYSMAHTVEIKLPRLEIHCPDYWPHGGPRVMEGGNIPEKERCPTCRENSRMVRKVEEIIARAFPNHDDRRDSMTDYFDSLYSVN